MKNVFKIIKDFFVSPKCPVCGEYKGKPTQKGYIRYNYMCRCDAYRIVSDKPVKSEQYIDEHGVTQTKWIYAKDIYPTKYIEILAENMFEKQKL